VLDCGNSGTTMRLLSGMLAGAGLFAVLSGDASLRRRPMARIAEPLRAAGAQISGRNGGRLPPLAISPVGGLRGIEHRPSVASAQVKSALLLSGLFADGPTSVVERAATRDHTERLLRAMGAPVTSSDRTVSVSPVDRLTCVDVEVPGDFSSAAFWLVLGVLHPDAEVRVNNVGLNPTRTGLLTILERMGARISLYNRTSSGGEPVADLEDALLKVLAHTDVCSRRPLIEHYDTVVRGATVIPSGYADAGVIILKRGARTGVALSVDGNPRYAAISAELAVYNHSKLRAALRSRSRTNPQCSH